MLAELEVWLLRALLCPPPAAAVAWSEWLAATPEPEWLPALRPYRRVWPLLGSVDPRLPMPRPLSIGVKSAVVAERVRAAHLWRLLREGHALVRRAGIDTMVIGGMALARAVYPEPGLRHCHAVRLAVADVEAAARVLSEIGFEMRRDDHCPTALAMRGTQRELFVLESALPGPEGISRDDGPQLQAPKAALTTAWSETLPGDAPPLLWACDVFFVDRAGDLSHANDLLCRQAAARVAGWLR